MGIDRATLEQIRQLLRPIANRVANLVARATVSGVADGGKLQRVQVGALADETIDDVEHHQPYGFSSVPLAGAEAIAAFPNGDRSHPIAVVISDRRHRPRGGQAGEVCLYTDEGDVIRLGRGRVISIEAGTTLKLGSASASQDAIKGTQRNTDEQTFLTALNAFVIAVGVQASPTGLLPNPALATACATMQSAIGVFKIAAAAALSSKVKLE